MSDKQQSRIRHWKTDIVGLLVMMMATAYLIQADWSAMWTVEHISAGIVAFLILLTGFGVIRRWGFRDR